MNSFVVICMACRLISKNLPEKTVFITLLPKNHHEKLMYAGTSMHIWIIQAINWKELSKMQKISTSRPYRTPNMAKYPQSRNSPSFYLTRTSICESERWIKDTQGHFTCLPFKAVHLELVKDLSV